MKVNSIKWFALSFNFSLLLIAHTVVGGIAGLFVGVSSPFVISICISVV
jgi:predicted MFS family arabinose efflux permease